MQTAESRVVVNARISTNTIPSPRTLYTNTIIHYILAFTALFLDLYK